jgi:hypothetical protein
LTLKAPTYYFCLLHFEGKFTSFFKVIQKSQNNRNQGFPYYFLLDDRSIWIRIRNTADHFQTTLNIGTVMLDVIRQDIESANLKKIVVVQAILKTDFMALAFAH